MLDLIISIPVIMYILLWISFIIGYVFIKNKQQNISNYADISVIIPFRNEEKRIHLLLDSLNKQENRGNYELIFVDDNSDDNSLYLVSDWLKKYTNKAKLLSLKNTSGKKNAIEYGINKSTHSFILTLDADLELPGNYFFYELQKEIEIDKDFYIIPVAEHKDSLFISVIESYILSIITYVSAKYRMSLLASGAGLLFKRDLFFKLQPYKSNKHISSGDDMFFLSSVLKYNSKLIKVISPKRFKMIVQSPTNYLEFIQSSIRRASKMSSVKIFRTKFIGFVVVTANISLLLLLINSVINNSFDNLLILALSKYMLDFTLFLLAIRIYGGSSLLLVSSFMIILYPLHIIIVILFSIFTNPFWKGRPL